MRLLKIASYNLTKLYNYNILTHRQPVTQKFWNAQTINGELNFSKKLNNFSKILKKNYKFIIRIINKYQKLTRIFSKTIVKLSNLLGKLVKFHKLLKYLMKNLYRNCFKFKNNKYLDA